MTPASPSALASALSASESGTLAQRFAHVRAASEALAAPLAPEDMVIQSMPDASPTKWHLAHTTWFFESFVLGHFNKAYKPHHPRFGFLFNSYYNTVGEMHRRPLRGLLSRPTVDGVAAYRADINDRVQTLIAERGNEPEVAFRITLGLHHEQQHQELIVTDIKHALAQNPLQPAYVEKRERPTPAIASHRFINQPDGVLKIGFDGDNFAFDNETPRHDVLMRPHALANRPITNGEYREFVKDNGYTRADLWLSDGWSTVNTERWTRPLYWHDSLDSAFTLCGEQPLDDDAPVCHISFYEADAFARWSGARLATEAELERALSSATPTDDFVESGHFHPGRSQGPSGEQQPLQHLYGGVWEWTQSSYAPYPGFAPLDGSLGEYNGKFMCNQLVLRGGSCATPASHIRPTYRNFFYPQSRWQFSGIRLAKDIS
ncbi:MAG: ergothioneine biosynthesis protein EgtB [Gammaproteobacteria bacterium]